ncbi:hypothetical protein C1645_755389 [Glomus cerebriforme]|uniref:Methyltransferase domain-containing protein n=1 Tax=Glomus cerebriforme TaxID=658196 RepID=A0A397TFS3_9GLOM|nr:hypothetical protein C1645_755389 [Glomus cerebriforme]
MMNTLPLKPCARYNYLPSDNNDIIDRDLLYHYIFKSVLRGNCVSPFNNSIEKVLEIGYSSGYWMMEMATDWPKCQFYGIDIEPSTPDQVYPSNCFFEKGDYLNGLPYPNDTFSMVTIRIAMFGLSNEQLSFLLDEVRRISKKESFFEFLMPDLNIGSLGPLFKKLLKILGGNNNGGNKIDQLLANRGFLNVANKKIVIPLVRGSTVGELGEFSLSALSLFIKTIDSGTKSLLNLSNEEDLMELIQQECEQYNTHLNFVSGVYKKI